MKKCFLIFLICLPFTLYAEGWIIDWHSSVRFAGSTGEYMPFWSRTGEDGILPVRSSGLLTAGADVSYKYADGLFFEAGANMVGALAMKSPLNTRIVYGFIDRLFVSGGWKMLRFDIGMKPRRGDLGELSITGGDILYSGNARTIPGINLSSDWIYFEKGHWVGIKGNLAHYQLVDDRCVRGAMVHNKSLALKVALGPEVDLIAGFNHTAQWGGYSEADGPQGQSFQDYVKVFFAKRGDATDSMSDQMNIFGNHIGNEWLRINWRADSFRFTFQYDKLFEDNSGMIFRNFPDGVWTLQFSLNDRTSWVTDVTYEFINTTWQSGDAHDMKNENDETVILGGRDNYFNNSPYASGWTNYGRTIGLPLMIPGLPVDGISRGIVNNRVRGHHLGMAGVISQQVPYRLKATFTENFGTYHSPFDTIPWQLSLALEADMRVRHLPMIFSIGLYGDVGRLYQNSAGLTLRIFYNDSASFRSR